MVFLFRSSRCQPPDPSHLVRFLLATRALHPLPLFSHQKLLLSSLISSVRSINAYLSIASSRSVSWLAQNSNHFHNRREVRPKYINKSLLGFPPISRRFALAACCCCLTAVEKNEIHVPTTKRSMKKQVDKKIDLCF